METLLQPYPGFKDVQSPFEEANNAVLEIVRNSVLSVGMLPTYQISDNNNVFDASAMNIRVEASLKGEWRNLNTNGMRWITTRDIPKDFQNIPHLNGVPANLGDYLEYFISGFNEYSYFLLSIRDARGVDFFLDRIKGLSTRQILRPTRFYYGLLSRLKDYRNMRDGVCWSAHADFLSRLCNWETVSDPLWKLLKSERLALTKLNIPLFSRSISGDVITDSRGNHVVDNSTSAYERSKAIISQLSNSEIERQTSFIEMSTSFLGQKNAYKKDFFYYSERENKVEEHASPPRVNSRETEVKAIATRIYDLAIRKQFSAAWCGLDWLGDSDFGTLTLLGADLYNGSSGIALFCSAFASEFDDDEMAILARNAIASVRAHIHSRSSARWARTMGIGGTSGIGSVVYALTKIGGFLGDKSIIEDALVASSLFSEELISLDRALDLVGGAAGGILTNLALYRVTKNPLVLGRAVACGEHLLNTPRIYTGNVRCWRGVGMKKISLNGISHGAAGFSYALFALANETGREDFLTAAYECVDYINFHFKQSNNNWADISELEGSSREIFSCQWCHGAPGIGLSFIGVSKFGGFRGAFRDKISAASASTILNCPQELDTMCCGRLGSLEFLAEASIFLNDSRLHGHYKEGLSEMLVDRFIYGDYRWNAGSSEFNLGLFRGISGIGYSLLRSLNKALPNVLIFE